MPSNALRHLPSTYLSILMEWPLTASSFHPLITKNWEHSPSLCQFPNEFLTWLSKPSQMSLPLASTSTLTSHTLLWKIYFSGIHLFLQICPCLHTQKMRWTVHVPRDFPYWTVNSLKARTIPHSTVVSKEWCLIYIHLWNDYGWPFNNFELHGFTDTQIFFSINTCTIFGWEAVDAEG